MRARGAGGGMSFAPPQRALYVGAVRHRRLRPCRHVFERRLLMLWSNAEAAERGGFWRWRRRQDLLRPQQANLAQAARDEILRLAGVAAAGAVYVLAQPRQFGVAYNPASFYVACHANGEPAALLVEVHNTPWGERFCYAAAFANANGGRANLRKQNHVSPFNPMQMRYRWRFGAPGKNFTVAMRCLRQDGAADMQVVMRLRRRAHTPRNVALAALAQPAAAAASLALIYWQALRLWLKGAPVYAHKPAEAGE